MKFPISRRRRRFDRVAGRAVRYAIETLEERTLLNSYVVTSVDNSGAGTLRDAIQQANSNPGLDLINFDISGGGVHTIKPTFFLPQITDPLEIHGESQSNYAGSPVIELDGSLAGSSNGLEFKVGGNVVEGLDIHGFALDGIVIAEPTGPNPTGNNSVLKNFIGTDPTGKVALGNQSGIHLIYSPHDLIKNNLISGNTQSGVFVADQFSTDTHIEGNLIGTDITGLLALPNKVNGVALGAPPTPTPGDGFASGNFVGGTTAAQRNIISGNGLSGIWIKGGSGNTVQGNYIGVGVDGTKPLGNGITGDPALSQFGTDGVIIVNATNNNIGGTAAGAANLISANNSDGVQITGAATGNKVVGNLIGTSASGLNAIPNGRDGVSVFDSAGNTIGGQLAGSRNVISGNKVDGVYLGATISGSGAVANLVLGNFIGVDATGITALANQKNGVEIEGGTNNVIGGSTSQASNTISGNLGSGVLIGGFDSIGNQVLGNMIGTDALGLIAIPNSIDGVDLFDSSLNVIGGTNVGSRNIISGNGLDGVVAADGHAVGNVIEGNFIGTDISGRIAVGNAHNGVVITALSGGAAAAGNVIGGSVAGAGNLISGNVNDGVEISLGADGNSVVGNLVGTTAAGDKALANGRHGVAIFDSNNNTIGAAGTPAASPQGNVISGNKGSGVLISGAATGTATANKVLGNFIGVDQSGTHAVPNVQDGVLIQSAAGDTIGGTSASSRNIISGNGSAGVVISGAGARNDHVDANYIGTDVTGTSPLPNAQAGVFINNVPSNFIGDGGAGLRNIISGNDGPGLYITGKDATKNDVFGNFIGVNSLGLLSLANTGDGVLIENSPSNLIGGIEVGQGNVISGNLGDGIDITGADATGNQIQHNDIGTDLALAINEGNQKYGVEVQNGAKNNTIGGNDPLFANTIEFNGAPLGTKGYGVEVPAAGGNAIRDNSIFNNAGRGIDMVNPVTPDTFTINDFQSAAQPNDPVQDTPVVNSVTSDGVNTAITWYFNSTPNSTFTFDFFSNSKPNPSGFGDGEKFLQSRTFTTGPDGNYTFSLTFPAAEKYISVTATGPSSTTSEFSMVDTDADGLADAWETTGIDLNEDGTADLTLPGANPNRKDVYVEIDSIGTFAPTTLALTLVTSAFARAPVLNVDGSTGISLHLQDDETMPDRKWIGDLNGDNVVDAFDLNPWNWFAPVKQNGINGVGGFGTAQERKNPVTLSAKALAYRYAIFADQFQIVGADGTVNNSTSGIAEIGGNDLIVALGGWGQNADTDLNEAGTFMHELGHTLGLHHGGTNDINFKPNYLSVMNYKWQVPRDWMYEDTNHNGVQDAGETDINGNHHFGDTTWFLNYSDTTLDPIAETSLDETKGIGGIAGDWETVGPNGAIIPTSGPVDWNGNGTIDPGRVTTGIDLNNDSSLSIFNGFNDWGNIQYSFNDRKGSATGAADLDGDTELTLEQWEADNAQGPGPGVLEFHSTVVNTPENGAQAVIMVLRGAGTTGTVTVDYSTSDGTANAGSDYTATSGTITFADGEYIKTITVPIIDDSHAENAEFFNVKLSNATGGAEIRADENSATVNIADNDTAGVFTVTNTNDSGVGSLRQAILDANSHPGTDLINFNIGAGGVQTISPLSTLPTITDPVTIDGTSQPGYAGKPIIELSGVSAPGNGLTVFTYNTAIRGLVINRFVGTGINATGLQSGSINFNNLPPVSVTITGDYIGTDVTGLLARPNGTGIVLGGLGGFGFVVGGTSAADRNVVSGNSSDGIFLTGGGIGFSIEGNYIGLGADGITPLGNGNDGVYINTGGYLGRNPQSVLIGGPDASDGNVIAYNTLDGIEFRTMEQFLSNSIFGNGALGIGNFYQNVLNDSGVHDGINDQQNYPLLSSALSSNGHTVISGSLISRPDQTYVVQFFGNPTVSPSGYGQGLTYLGSTSVTTDHNGHANFTATLNVAVANGQLITSTATGAVTSGFSVRVAVGDVLGNVYVVNTTDDTDDGATNPAHMTLRDAIFDANNHPGLDTIQFNIPGGGVRTISPLTPLPAIIDLVIIDATTQPGYAGTPLIQLSGSKIQRLDISGAPLPIIGIYINTNGSIVRGLDINSFFKPLVNGISAAGTPILVAGNNNVIEGNFVGTDPTGTVAMPNMLGVSISGTGNRVGGTTPAQRNLFSGNNGYGLSVAGPQSGFDTGSPNLIEGNFIGTDITGTKALGNGTGVSQNSVGLNMRGANILGGSVPGAGNLISGNLAQAVMITSGEGSIIQGNFIGTDVTGTKKINNQGQGIDVYDNDFQPTSGVTIGGTQPGAGNLISGNMGGIIIVGSLNIIQGNKIGTDITGTLKLGNLNWGITVQGDSNTVGGPATGAGNLISGNGSFGVLIIATGTVIQGNRIGTQADGVSPLGNSSDGIAVASDFTVSPGGTGPFNDLIGGTDSGDANIIAFNGRDGINIAAGLQIGILSNSIYSNTSFGIDLGANGHTANDANDTDTGVNNLQNFPVLTTIVTDGTHTTVTGTLNSTPATVFMLQFFANPTADPSGFGQGQTLLGTRQVITDASGNAAFTVSFSVAVPVGQFISATTTDPQNNTSEFSSTIQIGSGTVTPNQPPTVNVGGPYTINEGSSLPLDASRSSDPDGDPLTYSWDINGDGVFGDATGVKPTLTWAQLNSLGIVNGPSSFTVKVRVDDGQAHVVTSSPVTLSLLNVAPTANAGAGQNVNEEDTVTLTGAFTDPGSADTHTFLWHVDAGNGQVIPDGSGSTFSFVPSDNGTYTVTFKVTDSDGGVGSAVVVVNVANVDPVATIIGLPAQGILGVPVNLTPSATDVSPVDTAAGFEYEWDVNLEGSSRGSFSGETPDFSFTPTLPGTYDIDLFVTDKDGGSTFVSTTLAVMPVVSSANFTPGGSGRERITVLFDQATRPAALTLSDFRVRNALTGASTSSSKMALTYDPVTGTAVITFPGLTDAHLADGRYQLTIPLTSYSFNFFRLIGDDTQDATVDFNDLVTVAQNYDKTNPQLAWSDGDFNGDGSVDFADLVAVAQNYGRSLDPLPAAAIMALPIPAPAIVQSVIEQPAPVQNAARPAAKPAVRGITDLRVAASAHSVSENRLAKFSTARLSVPVTKNDLITSAPRKVAKPAILKGPQNARVASSLAPIPFAPLSPFSRKKSTHRATVMPDD